MTDRFLGIDLGDEVKDTVTGFTGIVLARTEWLNGCGRLQVQSRSLDKDNKPQATEAFDVEQMVIIKKAVVATRPAERKTGGPTPTVSRGAEIR